MLPLAGDGAPLDAGLLARLEERAEQLASSVVDEARRLLAGAETVFLAYAGSGPAAAAALIAYWPLSQVAEKPRPLVAPLEAYTHHYAAYHDERTALLVFAEPGAESIVARSLATARIMGATAVVIGPPLPGPAAAQAEGHVYAELVSHERPWLLLVLAAAKLAAGLAETLQGIRLRLDRLRREYGDIASVYDSLSGMYRVEVEALSKSLGGGVEAYYSPTLEAAARHLAYLSGRLGGCTRVAPLSGLVPSLVQGSAAGSTVVLLSTGAEADLLREAEFRLRMKNKTPVKIVIDTDPLTASLYGVLLAEAAYDAARGGRGEA